MESIIAAIGKNRELGRDNKLLWGIPDDLKRFKELTSGHPIIMGRKTFESIGKPLPNRTNIIVTRDENFKRDGCVVVNSIEDAFKKAKALDKEIFVIGGAQIYKQSLPYVKKLYLTLINEEADADTFFPPYEEEFIKKLAHKERVHNGIKYQWIDFERITSP